jgi:hypothetical protein
MQEPTFDLINEESKNSWMEQEEPSYLGVKMSRKIDNVRTLLPRPSKMGETPTKKNDQMRNSKGGDHRGRLERCAFTARRIHTYYFNHRQYE